MSEFKIGDCVCTNERYMQQTDRINHEFGTSARTYHTGHVTNVRTVKFDDASIPDLVMVEIDNDQSFNGCFITRCQ